MAERSRLRAERAERLARLVPVQGRARARSRRTARCATRRAGPPLPTRARRRGGARGVPALADPGAERAAAARPAAAAAAAPARGAALPAAGRRPRPAPAAPKRRRCDLERLAGVGPGLAWALRRAGIPDLASVAALEPEALAARLGPLGRLVPARAWIAAARAAPDIDVKVAAFLSCPGSSSDRNDLSGVGTRAPPAPSDASGARHHGAEMVAEAQRQLHDGVGRVRVAGGGEDAGAADVEVRRSRAPGSRRRPRRPRDRRSSAWCTCGGSRPPRPRRCPGGPDARRAASRAPSAGRSPPRR